MRRKIGEMQKLRVQSVGLEQLAALMLKPLKRRVCTSTHMTFSVLC